MWTCAARPIDTVSADHGISIWRGGNQSEQRDQSECKALHIFSPDKADDAAGMNTPIKR
jgi:hypothetical protein